MSKYAQIITSFERTGNFPLEANYIFPTVEDLKQFYSDEIQAATLHKGLLKIVESNEEGKQALYWVTKKATKDELEFTELVAGNNISEIVEQLASLEKKLDEETTQRKNADTALWGVNDPTAVDEDYNSINDLANQVKALQEALKKLNGESITGDDSLKNQVKALVGTTDNDIVGYLDTLPYSTITEIANTLDRLVNGKPTEGEDDPDYTDIIDTLPELAAFLEGYTNKDTLKKLLEKLWFTIEGPVLPSESFRTLRGIEDYLIEYRTANDYHQKTLLEEMNRLEVGVGLNADGSYSPDVETHYLKGATSVMNALQILDSLLHKYISANVPSVRNEDTAIQLSLTQELDSYVLAAALKLSTQAGNQLVKNNDGLYVHAKTYYDKGVLTFMVNDNIVSQHYIGMNAIVQDARYDKDNEQLVFVFKLDNGDTQTVNVPVGALIREWEPYNRDTSPIILERYQDVAGTDKLSADVRISNAQWNILELKGNALYVKGTTDNIYHKGLLLSEYLDSAQQEESETIKDILTKIAENKAEIENAKQTIQNEVVLREQADELLSRQIAGVGEAQQTLRSDLEAEETARKNADNAVLRKVDEETQRASTEEARLQLEINSEAERAKQAEQQQRTILQSTIERLNSEVERATKVDVELQSKIDNLQHPEYKIEKQSTPEPGCSATYLLTKNGIQSGAKIDVPEVPVKISATYIDGVFTLVVNDNPVGIFDLSLAALVKDSYYDASSDELVVEYNLHNNKTQVVRTPFRALLEKVNASLAEVDKKIDTTVQKAVEDITKELDKKAPIDSPIFTGVPLVETSPDDTDSSQRIPSTAWVQARMLEVLEKASQANLNWIEVTGEPLP